MARRGSIRACLLERGLLSRPLSSRPDLLLPSSLLLLRLPPSPRPLRRPPSLLRLLFLASLLGLLPASFASSVIPPRRPASLPGLPDTASSLEGESGASAAAPSLAGPFSVSALGLRASASGLWLLRLASALGLPGVLFRSGLRLLLRESRLVLRLLRESRSGLRFRLRSLLQQRECPAERTAESECCTTTI